MAARSHGLDTEVVVVGAGPAGTAAAIRCREAGVGVTILERVAFPRERPGETLHPGVHSALASLGAAAVLDSPEVVRHPGVWSSTAARLVPYGGLGPDAWRGYQITRGPLDVALLSRALDLGARVRQPCRATSPLVERGRVVGVETSQGPLRSRYVVDAAGPGHWIARGLRLGLVRDSPALRARYGRRAGSCPTRDRAPAFTVEERGWSFTARVGHDLYSWTRLDLSGAPTPAEYVPEELRALRPAGPSRSADVSWRRARVAAGAGFFACGDAGALLDPAASQGVLRALLSGATVGRMISECLAGRSSERAAAARYRMWLEAAHGRETLRLRRLYSQLADAPGWSRAEMTAAGTRPLLSHEFPATNPRPGLTDPPSARSPSGEVE